MLNKESKKLCGGLIKQNRHWPVFFILCTIILWSLGGCSSSDNYSSSISEMANHQSVESAPSAGLPIYAQDSSTFPQEEAEYSGESLSEGEFSGEIGVERKIIREQYIEQQVQDLANVISSLEKSIAQLPGAYVESLREWKREEREQTIHNAEIIMRIPIDNFPAFLSQVEQQGNIIDRHLSGQDVTEEFVDNEARLRNLKRHEERILQLYERAETIEEMLQIEQELTRIRSSIEQLEGRQKYLNQVTSTAKLTLQLFQVEQIDYLANQAETSIMQEAGLGFQKSIQGLVHFIKRAFVNLITALPYLLVIVILLIPVYFLLRFIFKRQEAQKVNRDQGGND